MRKKFFVAVTVSILALLIAVPVYAGPSITVDGEPVVFGEQGPVMLHGRTFIPIDEIFDIMGFDVAWNQEGDQVTLTSLDNVVVMTMGSDEFSVDGEYQELDYPMQLIYGVPMLLLRPILDITGYQFIFDGATQTVHLFIDEEPPAGVHIQGNYFSGVTSGFDFTGWYLHEECFEALRQLPNFTWFEQRDNSLAHDISQIATLTNLTSLRLSGARVSDISPLSALVDLRELNLDGNQISDVAPLAGLENLTHLSLRHNRVSDLTPLAGLSSLESLYLGVNQITDISVLSGLTNLTRLDIGANDIDDLSPIAALANLEFLDAWLVEFEDFSPMGHIEWVFLGR